MSNTMHFLNKKNTHTHTCQIVKFKISDDSTNASSNIYFIMKEIVYDFVFVSVCEISVCVLCI